jgi:ubiquinone/menaquinone biosynthesis C-methylase UbiE
MVGISRKSGEDVVRGYEEYARTPHGRLRHDLLFEHYANFLERYPVRWILDLGGGTGLLLWRLMHRFPAIRCVLVDDDEAMVKAAQERLSRNVPGRAEVQTGSHRNFEALLAARASLGYPYLVSFNHVIEYVEDQDAVLRGLARTIAPGSYLGVMYLNNSHEALRRIWHKDSTSGFLQQLETGAFDAVNFGMARAITTRRLHAAITGAGLLSVEEYGLRCFAEWKSKEFIDAHYDEVLDAEKKVGRHEDFLGLARYRLTFFHRPAT